MEDPEHELLFVGAGPIGGKFKLTVFKWDDETRQALTKDHIVKTFTDKDLGGYADIATAVFFTESFSFGGSSGGCNTGVLGMLAVGLCGLFALKNKKR